MCSPVRASLYNGCRHAILKGPIAQGCEVVKLAENVVNLTQSRRTLITVSIRYALNLTRAFVCTLAGGSSPRTDRVT